MLIFDRVLSKQVVRSSILLYRVNCIQCMYSALQDRCAGTSLIGGIHLGSGGLAILSIDREHLFGSVHSIEGTHTFHLRNRGNSVLIEVICEHVSADIVQLADSIVIHETVRRVRTGES